MRFFPAAIFLCLLGVLQASRLDAAASGEIDYHDAVNVTAAPRDGNVEDYMPEMNVEATPAQLAEWTDRFPLTQTYVATPESRFRPLRPMYETIPAEWLKLTPATPLLWQDTVQPGEYYVFQIGVYPLRQDLKDLRIEISDWENGSGQWIAAKDATCFNRGGVDIYGKPFRRRLDLIQGHFQPLWFGIQIPADAAGVYRGKILLAPENAAALEVPVELTVSGPPLADGGISRDRALSKLKWLNSTIAQDDEVTKGYEPLRRSGNTITLLGREVTLGTDGLPQNINTFFVNGNQDIGTQPRPVLAEPVTFAIFDSGMKPEEFTWSGPEFLVETTSCITWRSRGTSAETTVKIEGAIEFDGFMEYRIAVTPTHDHAVEDIQWQIPYTDAMSQYLMGMNHRGGTRPEQLDWSWDVNHRGQDTLWIGGVAGGISCRLLGPESHARQVNVYYSFSPLRMPLGWGNFGKGGAQVRTDAGVTRFTAFCGRRMLSAGETVDFGIEMNLTPVKRLDRNAMYQDRFVHTGSYSPNAKVLGATVQTMHHATDGNEWINAPFRQRNVNAIAQKARQSHQDGVKFDLYYTVRETSMYAPELLAALGLNGEIIFPGPGKDTRTVIMPNGPTAWHLANLRRNFIPAWPSTLSDGEYAGTQDVTILPCADSRWDNLYLEWLDYLLQATKIDGIYVDDTLNGRTTMRRARKIIDRRVPDGIIDLHSWNHFNELAGYECSLILYLPILPYLDRLWIGEARNYDFPPDYWLVEISGIPFGVPSQMLHGGGQPWRGMLFGMTARGGYGARHEPAYMWKFWDEFGIADTQMQGFWEPDVPVRTDNPLLPVTVYRGEGKLLLAIANWSDTPQTAELFIDYAALGMDPAQLSWRIPAIGGGFQEEAAFDPNTPLTVPGGKGFLIEATRKH